METEIRGVTRSEPVAPPSRPRRNLVEPAAVLVVALVLSVAAVWHLQGYVPDDAYITYRFARNLANGHGWTYNPGELTGNGATSPLYTLVLAAGAAVVDAVPRLATAVFILSTAASALLVYRTLTRLSLRGAGLLAIPFLTLNPWLASTRGMESALFLALTSASLYTFLSRRMFLAGLLGGMLTLVRGEGILLCAVLGVLAVAQTRRVPVQLVAGGAVAGLPWGVYSLATLGSVLPDTLAAKVAQSQSGFWGSGWIFLRDWEPLLRQSQSLVRWGMVLALLAVVGLTRLWLLRLGAWYTAALLAFTGLFVLFYGVLLNVPGYHWYYSLPVYTLSVLAAVGGAGLWQLGRTRRDPLHLSVALLGCGGLLLFGLTGFWQGFNGSVYRDVGLWIRDHTAPAARVAATEIGYIGWYSERPMIDYLGLLTPVSARELGRREMTTWVRRENPDYWVRYNPPLSFEEDVAAQLWFPFAFEQVYEWGDRVAVYEKVRSLQEAERLAADALRSDTAAVVATLRARGVVPTDMDVAPAVEALLRVYAQRPDLRMVYGASGDVELMQLLEWATRHGVVDDSARVPLGGHRDVYSVLLERAQAMGGLRLEDEALHVLRPL